MKDEDDRRDDGGSRPVNPAEIEKFKSEVKSICSSAQYTGWRRRKMAEDTRYCRWEGQASDGRKHQRNMERRPFPFEGASDGRVRTVDTVVNYLVAVLVNAAYRSQPRFSGMESSDEAWAGKMSTLLRYMLRNHMGSELRKQLTLLAQYILSDSPGAGVLQVYWDRQVALESRTITLADLAQQLFNALQGQVTMDDLRDLANMIADKEREDEAIELLGSMLPGLKERRLRNMVGELREDGQADFPIPYVAKNGPKACALRLFEDIFFNGDTIDDIQRAPMVMIPEWLEIEEAKAKVVDEKWDQKFVDALITHKGKDGFEGLYQNLINEGVEGDYSEAAYERVTERNKEKVQIIHVMFKEVNEDGVMGLYKTSFSVFVDNQTATDREILDTPGAMYPLFYFPREILTRRILDSRGLPETLMTHQNALKLLFDSVGDHCQLTTTPPIKVPRRRPNLSLVIGPLAQIKEERKGEIDYMNGPEYPRAADSHREEVRRQIGEYTGVPVSESGVAVANVLLQFAVDGFLDVWGDAVIFMLKLGQDYWSDEDIARIVGGAKGVRIIRTKQEISGQYDLTLTIDIRDMDTKFMMEKIKLIKEAVLPIDTEATVDRARLTQRIMEWIDPVMAEDVIRPVEVAQQSEIDDEQMNFVKIKSGIEPAMVTEGQNFQLRLQVLTNIIQRNPQAVEEMSENSRKILEQFIKYRQHMVTQQENAVIGRTGAARALG